MILKNAKPSLSALKEHKLSLVFAILLIIVFLNSWDYFPFVDEVENLYDAFLVSRGLVPYRDYFTNHLPGVHMIMAPFFLALDPLLSNYQLHFVGRLFIFILHVFSNVFLFQQILNVVAPDSKIKNSKKHSAFLAFFLLVSYLVSIIFMTNLVWSESFLYCYLAISFGFFLKIIDHRMTKTNYMLWGALSAAGILISLIASPLIICNLFFIIVFLVIKNEATIRARLFSVVLFLLAFLIPTACIALILLPAVGWEDFYFQVIGCTLKYEPITAFGFDGLIGGLLRPLSYIIHCFQRYTFIPDKPVILSEGSMGHDSVFLFFLFLSIITLFLILDKYEFKEKAILCLAGVGLVYSSLVRGTHFHVGFGFHFTFSLSVLGFSFLLRLKKIRQLNFITKAIIFLPIMVGAILAYNGSVIIYRVANGKDNYTIEGTGQKIGKSKVKKLLADYNDPDGSHYKVWIPGFIPGRLYYSEMLPANIFYMFFPRGNEDAYYQKFYRTIIESENILILPLNDYPVMPKMLSDGIKRKIQKQIDYIASLK